MTTFEKYVDGLIDLEEHQAVVRELKTQAIREAAERGHWDLLELNPRTVAMAKRALRAGRR